MNNLVTGLIIGNILTTVTHTVYLDSQVKKRYGDEFGYDITDKSALPEMLINSAIFTGLALAVTPMKAMLFLCGIDLLLSMSEKKKY